MKSWYLRAQIHKPPFYHEPFSGFIKVKIEIQSIPAYQSSVDEKTKAVCKISAFFLNVKGITEPENLRSRRVKKTSFNQIISFWGWVNDFFG